MENTFDFDHASYGDLLTEAKRLNDELRTALNKIGAIEVAFANRDRQRNEASDIVNELIEEGVITDAEVINRLALVLNISATRTVTFTVTIELSGEVEIEYGQELDDYGFSVDGLNYNGESVYFTEGHTDVDWDEQ